MAGALSSLRLGLSWEGETTSDVIRHALLILECEEWHTQAKGDAERIMASGEDLNDEPEAW